MANETRLIDADAIFPNGVFYVNGSNPMTSLDELINRINNAPTVDAVEVVHGKWKYYSTTMQECSNCKRHTARHKFKYCPHCGAVMEDKYNDG